MIHVCTFFLGGAPPVYMCINKKNHKVRILFIKLLKNTKTFLIQNNSSMIWTTFLMLTHYKKHKTLK